MAVKHTLQEQISTSIPGITGRADDIDLKRRCSLTLIASIIPG